MLEIHPLADRSVAESGVDRSAPPSSDRFPEFVFPNTREAALSNGLRIVHAGRKSIPTVEFSLIVDAGYAADHGGIPGLARITAEMLDEGTVGRSALEISDELTRLGARIGSRASLDTATVTLSALTESLAESLDLYAEVVLRPSFPQEELDRLKQLQTARIQQEMSQPFTAGLRLLPGLLFGRPRGAGTHAGRALRGMAGRGAARQPRNRYCVHGGGASRVLGRQAGRSAVRDPRRASRAADQ